MSIILYVNIYYPLIILQNISAFLIRTTLEKKKNKLQVHIFLKWFFFYFLLCCVICDDTLLSLVNSAKCNSWFLSMLLFYFFIFSFTFYLLFFKIHLMSSHISSSVSILYVILVHFCIGSTSDFSWLHVLFIWGFFFLSLVVFESQQDYQNYHLLQIDNRHCIACAHTEKYISVYIVGRVACFINWFM